MLVVSDHPQVIAADLCRTSLASHDASAFGSQDEQSASVLHLASLSAHIVIAVRAYFSRRCYY